MITRKRLSAISTSFIYIKDLFNSLTQERIIILPSLPFPWRSSFKQFQFKFKSTSSCLLNIRVEDWLLPMSLFHIFPFPPHPTCSSLHYSSPPTNCPLTLVVVKFPLAMVTAWAQWVKHLGPCSVTSFLPKAVTTSPSSVTTISFGIAVTW